MTAYDTDFFRWTQETAEALEAGHLEEVNLSALSEEVRDLGLRDKKEVRSRLRQILLHLLKLSYQPEKATRSWHNSIFAERQELAVTLHDSPSLRAQVPELLPFSYKQARERAARETGLDIGTFPEECPYTIDEVLGQ